MSVLSTTQSSQRILLLALSFCLIQSCSSGSGSSTTTDPSAGIRLSGDPTALATSAIKDFSAGDTTDASEVSTTVDGTRVDRTNLSIALESGATTAEVNALLSEIDGTIVSMVEGVDIILVRIPDPGDLVSLDAVVDSIKINPIVREVTQAVLAEPDQLPANYDWLTSALTPIDHQIAVLAPAAWNAKAALQYPNSKIPVLIVSDSFGDGAPNGDFDLDTTAADFQTGFVRPDTNKPFRHGYQVLSAITARHQTDAGDVAERQLASGIFPGTSNLRVVDRSNLNVPDSEDRIVRLIRALKADGNNVLLNTSLHSGCPRPPTKECVYPFARNWVEKVRGSELFLNGFSGGAEGDFLHLASAGNIHSNDSTDASLNSQYTAARLRTDIRATGVVGVPPMFNTLVVENRLNAATTFEPGCLSEHSKFPGDISAIGEQVWSLSGASSQTDDASGTSFATPQVTGLAAYVWALRPSLNPVEVINILQKTARTPATDSGCGDTPQAVIDAYAAVLAADDSSALDPDSGQPLSAPARLAILDVADAEGNAGNNRAFDQRDLELFINTFLLQAGLNRDFSRFDLNGDGYTGGTTKEARFDLDIGPVGQYSTAQQSIDGEVVTFNEQAVSDWDVLCYYAYSPLYSGDPVERDILLTPHKTNCGATPATASVLFISGVDPHFNGLSIFSMTATGGSVTRLTENSSFTFATQARWSPDRLKVVYVFGPSGNKDIWVMDRDGGNQINLINDPVFPRDPNAEENRDDQEPQWSPDGSLILFSRSRSNGTIGSTGRWIYTMHADGSNRVKLTPDTETATEGFATWSPDGAKIAFTGNRDGANDDIFVMNADGSNPVQLTEDKTQSNFDIHPAWSPGGSRIFFRSNRDRNPDSFSFEIYSINADGSDPRRLTNSPENETSFQLSPLGDKIAFERNGDLFVMSAVDGSNLINLTQTEFLIESAYVWSPEGNELIYSDGEDLFVIKPDGTDKRNLSNNSQGWFPSDWK